MFLKVFQGPVKKTKTISNISVIVRTCVTECFSTMCALCSLCADQVQNHKTSMSYSTFGNKETYLFFSTKQSSILVRVW